MPDDFDTAGIMFRGMHNFGPVAIDPRHFIKFSADLTGPSLRDIERDRLLGLAERAAEWEGDLRRWRAALGSGWARPSRPLARAYSWLIRRIVRVRAAALRKAARL